MKAKEEARLSAVRMIKTALQKANVADPSKPLDEAAEQQILKSLVKQRIDAAEMFRKGGREELAAKEEAERKIIESYLPASASEEDIEDAVDCRPCGDRRDFREADGPGDEGRAGEAGGQNRGRQNDQRESEGQTRMTPTREHKPFVPPHVQMKEFTLRAVLLGLVMCVVLGAANAYLGLQRGPDHRGDLSGGGDRHGRAAHFQRLDPRREHRANCGLHRRIGRGGRGVHHPGVRDFALMARFLARHRVLEIHGSDDDSAACWACCSFRWSGACWWKIPTLPFPESVAASQIHKAGQVGAQAAKYLFYNMASRRGGVSRRRVQRLRDR